MSAVDEGQRDVRAGVLKIPAQMLQGFGMHPSRLRHELAGPRIALPPHFKKTA